MERHTLFFGTDFYQQKEYEYSEHLKSNLEKIPKKAIPYYHPDRCPKPAKKHAWEDSSEHPSILAKCADSSYAPPFIFDILRQKYQLVINGKHKCNRRKMSKTVGGAILPKSPWHVFDELWTPMFFVSY